MAELNGKIFDWKEFKFENINCPLCKSNDFNIYEKYGEDKQYTFVKCNNCKMLYQNPRFAYDKRFLEWAYTSYGDHIISRFLELGSFDKLIEDRSGYFKFKKELMDKYAKSKSYTLVDVGASCGEFIYFCNKHGADVTGVETSKVQSDFIKNNLKLKVIQGTLNEANIKQDSFDFVHCAHTIEHVSDPLQMILDLKKITKKGGYLLLEVPNAYSSHNYVAHFMNKYNLKKNTWAKGHFPEHLVEFSKATFERMITEAGLEVKYSIVHSRKAMEKNCLIKYVDILLNKICPYSNNIICIAQKVD